MTLQAEPHGTVLPDSDADEGEQASGSGNVLQDGADLPPGYTRERRVTAAGRAYSVYFAPSGRLLYSRPQCWREYADSGAAEPLSEAPSADEPEGVEVPLSEAPSPAEPAGPESSVEEPSLEAPSAESLSSGASPSLLAGSPRPNLFRRVQGRSRLCNKLDQSKTNMCSRPYGHDGLCDFDVLPQRRTARP